VPGGGDRMSARSRRERMALPRTPMPERAPVERARDFAEVNLGFTEQLALLEADRCLRCPRPRCVEGCPVGVRIDAFVGLVADGRHAEAAALVHADNALPGVCGRVCPQERQCEQFCVLAKRDRPIAVGHLERYVADWARTHAEAPAEPPRPASGRRVAIVGSGPAGLSCAADLVRLGHDVTVFEALHEPGGVLVYGIPGFRLPRAIVEAEIARLEGFGVCVVTNAPIGLAETVDDLLAEHDAVFLGVGAGLPRFLDVPGEHLVGVFSANEFLTRVNLMGAHRPDAETPVLDLAGRQVVVFGGGNTALDAARTAVRLGAARVTVAYRRTEVEMPARDEEVRHAAEEGVEFAFLVAPVALLGDDDGWLTGVRLQRMILGPPDDSGRRRPLAVEDSENELPADVAIVAVGNAPNTLVRHGADDLEVTHWGTLITDPDTGKTSKRGVFAGGDIVTGGATVILAMGAGRRAARAIDAYVRSGVWDDEPPGES
jgi:glutamate synthase (NADPH) small chain